MYTQVGFRDTFFKDASSKADSGVSIPSAFGLSVTLSRPSTHLDAVTTRHRSEQLPEGLLLAGRGRARRVTGVFV